jgi:hypothetical protein
MWRSASGNQAFVVFRGLNVALISFDIWRWVSKLRANHQ